MPRLNEIIGDVAYAALPEETKKQHGEVDFVNSTEHVPKTDYEALDKTAKQYVKDIKKRDDDLLLVQTKVKDNETLNQEIENLKIENKKNSEDHEAALKQIKFDAILEKKLGDFQPKNLGILKKQLEIEKISLDGENILGLDDQINALKESDPYLFKEEETGGTGNIGGASSITDKDDKGQLSLGARLAEQRKTASQVTENQNKFFN